MYDYGFRIYDPRIAKFLSIDPLSSKYPFYTPYQFAGNDPINYVDLDGLEKASPEQVGNAQKMINDFANSDDNTTVWENITKADFVASLRKVISDPNSITQGDNPMCGIACELKTASEYDPESLVNMAVSLYKTGSASGKKWYDKPIKADKDLYKNGSSLYEENDFDGLNSAEYVLLTSIKNTYNISGYNDYHGENGIKNFLNNAQGVTDPFDINNFLTTYFDIKDKSNGATVTSQIEVGLSQGQSVIILTSWNELYRGGEFQYSSLHYVHVAGLTFDKQSQLYTLSIWNPQTRNKRQLKSDFKLTFKELNSYVKWTFRFY